ncbi:MAG: MlaD family protein [Synergistales bacterium]|nr:MlaD family protein [Bacteroidales bacterium]MDY6434955.1 MlaD family protein [Synergistales bacterium]MDY6394330.1 MlaD family protein [Bacteroidales bacterium]MDY6395745.1 MlaD family protein [Bacteroidales bacterium]MDY6402891.1 MlaD family protein [Bacteroidales bacterium]
MKLRNEYQIGIAVLVTFIVLILGINFLKGKTFFSGQKTYYAIYDDVTGMHESSYIYVNGMKAGHVVKISPMTRKNDKFLVELSVDKNIDIPKDSRLTLFSTGLMSGQALRIDLGKSETLLQTKDTMQGGIEKGLTDEIAPMGETLSSILKRIDTLTNTLNRTIDEQAKQNIQLTLTNINQISQRLNNVAMNVDNLVSKDKDKLDRIVSNVESITRNLVDNNQAISNIISRFDNISSDIEKQNIGSTLAKVKTSLESINSMLNKIEKGEGNIGMLLSDEGLYRNITSAAKDLDELILDLKKNPKKYIHVSVF